MSSPGSRSTKAAWRVRLTAETRFPENDWRSHYFGPENLKNTVTRVDKLKTVVPKGMTLPEMALRFILSNPR